MYIADLLARRAFHWRGNNGHLRCGSVSTGRTKFYPKLRATWRALVVAQVAVIVSTGIALGQGRDLSVLSTADNAVERYLKAKRGIVVFDLDIDNRRCEESFIGAVRVVGPGSTLLTGPSSGVFSAHRLGAITPVLPGTYEVRSVSCKVYKHIDRHNVLFARFRVGPGEIVNIGRLKVKYKPDPGGNIFFGVNSGVVSKSVGPLDAATVAGLRERAPKTMAKAVARTMTMVGPATSKVKKR